MLTRKRATLQGSGPERKAVTLSLLTARQREGRGRE
jgi:hypothetical protein